jgi:TP901 family phage tail tape measure protein
MQKTLINSINATGKFAASLTNIKSSAENFTTSLEKNKLGLREYFRYAGASTQSFGKLFKSEFATIEKVAVERVKTLQTQYIKMGRDANGALQAIKVRPLTLDMQNLATQTAVAAQKQMLLNQLIKQGTTNLVNWGKNVQWAGRQLMVGFTLPLAVLGTTAAKSFMELEKQAVRFKRVYGEMFTSSGETEKALEDVKQLANEFTKYGIAVEKTLGLAADLAQQGLAGVALMAQVTQATRLAVLGEVEQQEALETTVSLTNAFGVAAEDLASKINFLNAVENQTITAIEDLTIAIPKAGPVVQQLGGDVEDLAFFLTAMKEGGINASEGANALKSGLASLINPSEKASEFLSSLGINIKGIVDANKGDVQGIVVQFAKALDDLDPLNRAQAIEQLFGKFQFSRLSTLFQNVIKEGSQANRVLELGQQTAEELAVLADRELKKVEDSPAFKFQKAIEDITVSLAPLGEQFLKLITPVVEFVTGMLKKFNEMSEGSKTFVAGLIAVLGLIAPVVLMTVGLVANGVGNLIKGFNQLRLFYNKLGGDSSGLASSTQYLSQEQLEAAAVAASLGQSHAQLAQIFTAETQAVQGLIAAYQQAVVAASALSAVTPVARARPELTISTNSRGGRRVQAPQGYADGVVSVPGPKGAGDVVPAMLSPGEAVIPSEQSEKYAPLIAGIIADNLPGYFRGRRRGIKGSQGELLINPDSSSAAAQRLAQYANFDAQDYKAIPNAASELDAMFPGMNKGTNAANAMASSGVKPEQVRQTFSLLLKAAKSGVEAVEVVEKAVTDTLAEAKKIKNSTEIKSNPDYIRDLKNRVRETVSTDKGDESHFTHITSGASATAKETLDMADNKEISLTKSQIEKLKNVSPESVINLRSGLGMSNFDGMVNRQMVSGGASRDDFLSAFDRSGDNRFDDSIVMGGGDPNLLRKEADELNSAFREEIVKIPAGTLVVDSQKEADRLEQAGQAAVSVEKIWATVRDKIGATSSELVQVLDNSAKTVVDIRSSEKGTGLKSPSQPERLAAAKRGTSQGVLPNPKLEEAYLEEIKPLEETSKKTSAVLTDQSESNKELSTTLDQTLQGTTEQVQANSDLSDKTKIVNQDALALTTSIGNLGTEAEKASQKVSSAALEIASSTSQLGPRRAQAAQGAPDPISVSKVIYFCQKNEY